MTGAVAFQVQGWCPGALRPMMSGDGLVVRVRPPLGRLTQAQAAGIAAAAARHGNGLVDLSARGNVQLRGVTEASHGALIAELRALDLIDADAADEARRNILVTPFADAGTDALAARLGAALAEMPPLPGKFGFVVDTGPAPVFAGIAGDIRLERAGDGRLVLRCDGLALGAAVAALPAAFERALALDWQSLAERLSGASSVYVLGRGPAYAIACEAALKFKETCGLHAEAFSAAEVLHGPSAIVQAGFPVMALAVADAAGAGVTATAERLAGQGADVFTTGGPVSGAVSLPAVPPLHPLVDPLVLIVAFYAMVETLSRRRGFDPDRPRHL